MTTASKPKGMKKKSLGSIRARAGLPAKAGKRQLPVPRKGKHLTTPEERDRARYLSRLGFKKYFPVLIQKSS